MGFFDLFKKKKEDSLDDEIAKAQAKLAETKAKIAAGEPVEEDPAHSEKNVKTAMALMGIKSMTVDTSPQGIAAAIASTGNLEDIKVTVGRKNPAPTETVKSYGTVTFEDDTLHKCHAQDRSPMFLGKYSRYELDWSTFVETADSCLEKHGVEFNGDLSQLIDEIVGEEDYTDSFSWVYGLKSDGSAILYCRQVEKYLHFTWNILFAILCEEKPIQELPF